MTQKLWLIILPDENQYLTNVHHLHYLEKEIQFRELYYYDVQNEGIEQVERMIRPE